MIKIKKFSYEPNEHEAELASYSYLMSLVAIMAGMPLPIFNLIATLIFYMSNHGASYFVRWHCTQALISQLPMLFVNSVGFWWTISIFLMDESSITNTYITYMIFAFLFNLSEFIVTIYTTIEIRKGKHIEWWVYGSLTKLICKE
jgi:hypothetical protein